MIREICSIVLALNIVACPLICKGSSGCCNGDHSNVASGCCDACHGPENREARTHEPVPRDDNSRGPADCSGCICGGAVIEDSALQHLVLESYLWIAPAADTQLVDVISDGPRDWDSGRPLPDDGTNPGRAMRCLMMSFLC
jgi:hypothetical protein